jgi:hypothetical protein
MTMSRRMFMGSGVMGAASLATLSPSQATAAKSALCSPDASESVFKFFQSVAESLNQIIDQNPDAPGLRDLERLGELYPAKMGSEDDLLLQGALYLQAEGLIAMLAAPPATDELAARLSRPLAIDRLDPAYFSNLLETTKQRVACDEEYAEAVRKRTGFAVEIISNCRGWFKWLCLAVAVAITVLLIIAIV